MSKLFKLKEWLTLVDAARHLSIICGEDVTTADVLHLGLNGHLRLSVYFVNYAKARCGKVVGYEDAKFREIDPGLAALIPNLPDEVKGKPIKIMTSLNIDNSRYLNLDDDVTTLSGVWDLPMIGTEKLDVEHHYQILTGGPAVTLHGVDGAFVEGGDGQICQLQESFDDNEFQAGSRAQLAELKQYIAANGVEGEKAKSLLEQYRKQREEFLELRKIRAENDSYYPAGGLPEDAVIVVRTEALRQFEAAVNGVENELPDQVSVTNRDYVSDKLAYLNQAALKFWGNVNHDDRDTHPKNAAVEAWLMEHGFTPTLANKAATIIRPSWAPTGRKPEEH